MLQIYAHGLKLLAAQNTSADYTLKSLFKICLGSETYSEPFQTFLSVLRKKFYLVCFTR